MFDDNSPQGVAPKNLPVSEPDDMFSDTEKEAPAVNSSPEVGNSALGAGKLKPKSPDMAPPATTKASSGMRGAPNKSDKKPPMSKAPSLADRINAMPKEGYKSKEPVLGKVFIVIIVVAAAIGLGYGAWLFYMDYTEDTAPELQQNEIQSSEDSLEESEGIVSEMEEEADEEDVSEDNATTTEEGGETANEDTMVIPQPVDDDGDSLSNAREEELGTDPMLADTDGDGLRDGDEVIIWATNPLNADSDGDGYMDGEEIENGYNPMGPGKLFIEEDSVETSI